MAVVTIFWFYVEQICNVTIVIVFIFVGVFSLTFCRQSWKFLKVLRGLQRKLETLIYYINELIKKQWYFIKLENWKLNKFHFAIVSICMQPSCE